MAADERDREDLLRDARALAPRAQLTANLEGRAMEVVAGLRGSALSLFFDQDPVYHFNAAGDLRRAYVEGRLIKAELHRLVALDRRRRPDEVVLERCELDEPTSQALLDRAAGLIGDLARLVNAGQYKLVGQAPNEGDALAAVMDSVNALLAGGPLEIAAAPRL